MTYTPLPPRSLPWIALTLSREFGNVKPGGESREGSMSTVSLPDHRPLSEAGEWEQGKFVLLLQEGRTKPTGMKETDRERKIRGVQSQRQKQGIPAGGCGMREYSWLFCPSLCPNSLMEHWYTWSLNSDALWYIVSTMYMLVWWEFCPWTVYEDGRRVSSSPRCAKIKPECLGYGRCQHVLVTSFWVCRVVIVKWSRSIEVLATHVLDQMWVNRDVSPCFYEFYCFDRVFLSQTAHKKYLTTAFLTWL